MRIGAQCRAGDLILLNGPLGAGKTVLVQGIGQALGAAGQAVGAAMTPQQLYNQYASVIFGTPSAAYNPNFAGTQGMTTSGLQFGAKYGF